MTPIKNIKSIVESDMCIGCGLCSTQCKNDSIKLIINEHGFYTADIADNCNYNCNCNCINVCPFNPHPDEKIKTEDEIATIFLSQSDKIHRKIGRHTNIYAGYSIDNRINSSSGGIATYTLKKLMERGDIQHVISVRNSSENNTHYEYAISHSTEELNSAAKTKYYPVTLATALRELYKLDGKVAIVGVACFIKAVRLTQIQDQEFNKKIGFLIGIICGGVKSTFFAEYLANKAGVVTNEFSQPEFRIKDHTSTAGDYYFGCKDINKNQRTIRMVTVGDMWGTGLFKANACDYCDDVTAELADISLGDAWLEPYSKDGRGTNVIVTRSKIAEDIIKYGVEKGDLIIEDLSQEKFIASQQGSFNHRHDALGYRIKSHNESPKRTASTIPPKRFDNIRISTISKIIQKLRMQARRNSLPNWKTNKNALIFDKKMRHTLYWLNFFTRINHYQRAISRKIDKLLAK